MIRIGIAGLGFMGMVHYLSYQRVEDVQVGAIATRNAQRRAGDWTEIKGNFGPPGEQMDLTEVGTYESVDQLIGDDSLDAIDITLPPNLHADVAVSALESGKHVFCEKPLSLVTTDAQRMLDAARAAGKKILVGHVLPYFPEYRWARETAKSGQYGKLLGGAFRRVISDPAWLTEYWSAEKTGGPLLDLHIHDAHFIRLLFGKPSAVQSAGRSRNGLPEFWHTQFQYASGATVEATGGVINQQGRPFDHGFEIHLERATLVFEFAVLGDNGRYLCPPTLIDETGAATQVELSGGDPMDAFAMEVEDVVRCLNGDDASEILGVDFAFDALEICHAEAESLASGKEVRL